MYVHKLLSWALCGMPEVAIRATTTVSRNAWSTRGLCRRGSWQLSHVSTDRVKRVWFVWVRHSQGLQLRVGCDRNGKCCSPIIHRSCGNCRRPKFFGGHLAIFARQTSFSILFFFLPTALFCRQPVTSVLCCGPIFMHLNVQSYCKQGCLNG